MTAHSLQQPCFVLEGLRWLPSTWKCAWPIMDSKYGGGQGPQCICHGGRFSRRVLGVLIFWGQIGHFAGPLSQMRRQRGNHSVHKVEITCHAALHAPGRCCVGGCPGLSSSVPSGAGHWHSSGPRSCLRFKGLLLAKYLSRTQPRWERPGERAKAELGAHPQPVSGSPQGPGLCH